MINQEENENKNGNKMEAVKMLSVHGKTENGNIVEKEHVVKNNQAED